MTDDMREGIALQHDGLDLELCRSGRSNGDVVVTGPRHLREVRGPVVAAVPVRDRAGVVELPAVDGLAAAGVDELELSRRLLRRDHGTFGLAGVVPHVVDQDSRRRAVTLRCCRGLGWCPSDGGGRVAGPDGGRTDQKAPAIVPYVHAPPPGVVGAPDASRLST